jgi:hypothetical protein
MDPLADVIEGLFGGLVNPDEAISKVGPDAADLHVNRPIDPQKAQKRRTREQSIGLANNSFGAAAGALATGAAYSQARNLTPEKMKATRTGRTLLRATKGKPSRLKVAVPAAGTALVGIQAVNGLMDAQSGQYFARELYRERKKAVSKGMPIGGAAKVRRAAKAQERAYKTYAGNIMVSEIDRARPRWNAGKLILAGGTGTVAGLEGRNQYQAAKPRVKQSLAGAGDRMREIGSNRQGVVKADAKKKQAFGWISVTEKDGKPVLDRQNDYISLDEVEKSAYQYVRDSRHGGDMHARMGDAPVKAGEMIESFVVTPEKLEAMGIPHEVAKSVPKGWWGGYQITDDSVWEKIENGERAGFSIHGSGRREQRPLEELVKFQDALEDASEKARNLSRSKNRQVAFSLGASTLGLTALGMKGGATVARRVAQGAKVAGTPRAAKLAARGQKLDDLSMNTSIGAAGIGGVGGYNFAAQQHKEAKALKQQRMSKRSAQEVAADQAARGKETLRRVVQSPRITQHPEVSRRRREDAAIGGMTASAAGLAGSAALQRDRAIRGTRAYKNTEMPNKKVLLRLKPGDKVGTGAKALREAQKAARTKAGAAAVVGGAAYATARHRRSDSTRRFGDWYS